MPKDLIQIRSLIEVQFMEPICSPIFSIIQVKKEHR